MAQVKRPVSELTDPGLTNKSMWNIAFSLSWPAAIESLFVGLVDVVDTAMVSSLGTAAVAAVGLTSQPKRILLCFILAINVGATAIVSRRMGEKNEEAANRSMRMFLIISALFSLVLYTLGFVFAEPFMAFSGAKPDTIGPATDYFRYLVIGQFFQAISLTISACQRGAGNTKLAMRINVMANVVNVIFNYLLIYGKFGFPALGVRGAAIAASLGSVVAFGMAVFSITGNKKSVLKLRRGQGLWWDKTLLPSFWTVSSSAFLEQFCMRLGIFIYTLLIANLGTDLFATHQVCMNITNLFAYTYDGFAIGATTLVGQCMGADQPSFAERYAAICSKLSYLSATVIAAVLIIFRHPIIAAFSDKEVVIASGGALLIIIGLFSHACAGSVVYAGALRGAGDTKAVAMVTFYGTTILRPLLGWLLCYPVGLGLVGAWIGFGAIHYLRWVFNWWLFRRGRWKTIRL